MSSIDLLSLVLRFIVVISGVLVSFLLIMLLSNNIAPDQVKKRFSESEPSKLRFTECEVGLSLIIEQAPGLESALMPKTYSYGVDRPCEDLFIALEDPNKITIKRVRPRYWWGFRAAYGLLISKISISQSNTVMQVLGYSAFLLMLLGFYRLGSQTFLIGAPFVLLGAFFSGISFYSEAPLALGFNWALLAIAGLTFVLGSRRAHKWLYPFALAVGMICAFLWFMGGELLLLVPLFMWIAFFHNVNSNMVRHNFIMSAKLGFAVLLGFLISMAAGYALKAAIVGYSAVSTSFIEAAVHRLGAEAKGQEIWTTVVLKELLFRGFQHTAVYDHVLLWKSLIISGALAVSVSFCYLVVKSVARPTYYGWVLLLIIVISGFYFARILAVPNHSYIHAWMIGRYMIVPISLAWSMLIFVVLDYRAHKVDKFRSHRPISDK